MGSSDRLFCAINAIGVVRRWPPQWRGTLFHEIYCAGDGGPATSWSQNGGSG